MSILPAEKDYVNPGSAADVFEAGYARLLLALDRTRNALDDLLATEGRGCRRSTDEPWSALRRTLEAGEFNLHVLSDVLETRVNQNVRQFLAAADEEVRPDVVAACA